jgi:molybdopterin molybdotransferase
MISYPEAMEIIADAIGPLNGVPRGLHDLNRCATTSEVISNLDVPAFANSAMDGFAVRAAKTALASTTSPVEMPVVGMIAAGDPPPTHSLGEGAVEIMTGAPMPPQCDAVVPIEQVETEPADGHEFHQIRLREPVQAGRNVRLVGQDFCDKLSVLAAGSLIEPHDIMALAATGNDRLSARPMPCLSIITTGSELAMTGLPAQMGLIRDANGPYLAAFIQHIGATLQAHETVPDSPGQLEKAITDNADTADIILTTGGVSAGRFDMVPDTVVRLGGEVLFHKVGIRPGKPLLLARLPNGTLLFGLPGNPVAVAVGLRFFVVPAMRCLQGLSPERFHPARNLETIHKKSALRCFAKASATVSAGGKLEVRLLPGQESFKISPLLQANCWAIAPEGPECIEAGQLIEIAPHYPTSFLQ